MANLFAVEREPSPEVVAYLNRRTAPRSLADIQAGFSSDEMEAFKIIRNGLWAGMARSGAKYPEHCIESIMAATYLVDTLKKCHFSITQPAAPQGGKKS